MQKITPHLWFDKEAKEAAAFYTSLFENSKVMNTTTLHNTPSGDTDIVSFVLSGQDFMAISGGPLFTFNPSVSFVVACKTQGEVDTLWSRLVQGGKVLMPLDSYPFSDRFGWLEDRYHLSWQVMHVTGREVTQMITPSMLFVGGVCGRAEEAIRFYATVFKHTSVGEILRYGQGEAPEREGTVKHADFILEGQAFSAMDSALAHEFSFNEAISFIVSCETQKEIDDYWAKLSAAPEAEQCGWLKDRFGLSWQVSPRRMDEMMRDGSQAQMARVTEAFLKMKKFDIATLERAYAGK